MDRTISQAMCMLLSMKLKLSTQWCTTKTRQQGSHRWTRRLSKMTFHINAHLTRTIFSRMIDLVMDSRVTNSPFNLSCSTTKATLNSLPCTTNLKPQLELVKHLKRPETFLNSTQLTHSFSRRGKARNASLLLDPRKGNMVGRIAFINFQLWFWVKNIITIDQSQHVVCKKRNRPMEGILSVRALTLKNIVQVPYLVSENLWFSLGLDLDQGLESWTKASIEKAATYSLKIWKGMKSMIGRTKTWPTKSITPISLISWWCTSIESTPSKTKSQKNLSQKRRKLNRKKITVYGSTKERIYAWEISICRINTCEKLTTFHSQKAQTLQARILLEAVVLNLGWTRTLCTSKPPTIQWIQQCQFSLQ